MTHLFSLSAFYRERKPVIAFRFYLKECKKRHTATETIPINRMDFLKQLLITVWSTKSCWWNWNPWFLAVRCIWQIITGQSPSFGYLCSSWSCLLPWVILPLWIVDAPSGMWSRGNGWNTFYQRLCLLVFLSCISSATRIPQSVHTNWGFTSWPVAAHSWKVAWSARDLVKNHLEICITC